MTSRVVRQGKRRMERNIPAGRQTNRRAALARNDGGYTYLGVLFLVFLVGMGLSVASQWWHMEAKRTREQELLFVGEEFRKAIASYHAFGTPQYPKSLEDLVEDNRLPTPIRHLRRIYRDPMNGEAEWGLIKEQERIIGVHSLSKEEPAKAAGFPALYEEFSAAMRYSEWRFVHRLTAKPGVLPGPTAVNQPLAQPPPAQGPRSLGPNGENALAK
jgi:type II secretory pathway pseudopilin PulG